MNAAKAMRIGGWVLTALLGLFLLGASAAPKLIQPPAMVKMFEESGFDLGFAFKVGIVETICTVLFILPWTGFWGAILLTGYLGGATYVHASKGEMPIFAIGIGVLVWIALGLRRPEILALAMGKRLSARPGSGT